MTAMDEIAATSIRTVQVAASGLRDAATALDEAADHLAVARDATPVVGERMAARNRALEQLASARRSARQALATVARIERARAALVVTRRTP